MKELLARLRAKPLLALELLTASLFINVLALTPPLFFILVFNRYVSSGFDGTLITLSVGMILAVLFKSAFTLARNRLAEDVAGDRESQRLHQAFVAVVRSRPAALARLPKTQVMEAVQGPQALQAAYSPQNIGAVLDAPFAVLSVGLIFLLSTQLGLATLAGLAVTALFGLHGLYGARKPAKELGEAVTAGRHVAAQALQEPDTVRAFGGQDFLVRSWNAHMRRIQSLRASTFRVESVSQAGSEAAGLLMRAVIIALGARLVVQGQLSVGAVIGASFLAGLPMGVVSRLIRALSAMTSAQEQTAKLGLVAGLPLEPDKGLAVESCKGRLDFVDLAFAWPQAPGPLFESLSLSLAPGNVLVVTGRNGSGKTTLARLVVGLLTPIRGQIMVDGLDLRQVAPAWWRRQLVYLPQEPSFMNVSIRENIRMANPDITDENLPGIIERSGLRPYLNAHPQGLEQILADGGRHLSPGVRRRLALARALAADGPLVLLDDPTEALDKEGCRTMLDVIRDLEQRQKTILIFSNDMRVLNLAGLFLDLNIKPVPRVTQPGAVQGGGS
ncbi:ATP-binding cassette, subfamily C, LapB [Desulfonatronum zhilinae]|nr:ATP-binding cassette, subfamily C, LapB [Desulfonatronum zhilinae]